MARKAQAAMEFLMTYGWVIMIALTVIGALTYFGVFDIQKTLPDKCELGPGLECVDYHMSQDSATMVVQNTLGREITITELSFARKGDVFCSSAFPPVVVASGDTATISCPSQLDIRGKERFVPTVKFNLNDEPFEIVGDIFTTPEEKPEPAPSDVVAPPPLEEVIPPAKEAPAELSEPPPSDIVAPPPVTDFIPPPEEVPAEVCALAEDPYTTCTDEIDNDCDGVIDCSDPDCFVGEDCPAPPLEKTPAKTIEDICDNMIDDDSDDYIDCQDTDCAEDPLCSATETICADELDNDGDGLIDCSDVDCKGTKVCP